MKFKRINLSLSLILIFTSISWLTSCTHDPNITNLPEICFDGQVLPIFTSNCAVPRCHDGSRGSRMVLNNYAEIRGSVTPGNPGASRSYQVIISKWDNLMPPNRPLSLESRTIIRLWIEQGANQTTCSSTTGNTGQPLIDSLVNNK
jgi:hypothetical protein